MVSRAAITYNAPTVQVPTADNVMVDVDISINFTIAQDENAPSDFVYKIGAHNFNEYLSSKVEEAMRGLVYGVPHNKVNDLRESFAIDMLDSLRAKMAIFGIHMMNVKVTNVKLPVELQKRLEKTTAFQTKIEEAQVAMQYRIGYYTCVCNDISLVHIHNHCMHIDYPCVCLCAVVLYLVVEKPRDEEIVVVQFITEKAGSIAQRKCFEIAGNIRRMYSI